MMKAGIMFGCVITGSIGSGKSTASNLLKSRGFSVIDADEISHKMLENSVSEVVLEFGEGVLEEGKISRAKLSQIVFKDKKKLENLEKILHPKIKAEILKQSSELEKLKIPYFIDIPLYFERGNYSEFDKVAVVYAPKNLLIERVMKRNNLSFEAAKSRVELQIDIEQKAKAADFLIDNSRDLNHLNLEIEKFIEKIRERSACDNARG